jgi:hypothetical protein
VTAPSKIPTSVAPNAGRAGLCLARPPGAWGLASKGGRLANARTVGAAVLLCLTGTRARADNAQHTIGPSFQLTVINTKQCDSANRCNQSLVEAPAITYVATLGSTWGFQAQITGYFPVSAFQTVSGVQTHVDISSVYSSAWGIDAIFAAMRRFCFVAGLQLDVGLGPHFDGLVMKGNRFANTGYSDFNSFTLGVGMNAVLRWRIGSGPVSLAAFGSGAVDFVDLLHGGNLSTGFGLTTGALVGVDI